jgi:hypothetical protein
MKSFDPSAMARELIDRLLAPEPSSRIDTQVDRAMASFSCAAPAVWTEEILDRTLITLVQHLHLHATEPARRTPAYEALAEAQRLLAESYETQSGRGYDAAVVDVCADGAEAMKTVIAGMFEVFRERRNRQAFQWAIRSAIGPLDWRQRCQLAHAVARAGEDYLPSAILNSPPAQLVDVLVDLIMAHLRVETYFSQFLNNTWRIETDRGWPPLAA